jgi:hypothetical protein
MRMQAQLSQRAPLPRAQRSSGSAAASGERPSGRRSHASCRGRCSQTRKHAPLTRGEQCGASRSTTLSPLRAHSASASGEAMTSTSGAYCSATQARKRLLITYAPRRGGKAPPALAQPPRQDACRVLRRSAGARCDAAVCRRVQARAVSAAAGARGAAAGARAARSCCGPVAK